MLKPIVVGHFVRKHAIETVAVGQLKLRLPVMYLVCDAQRRWDVGRELPVVLQEVEYILLELEDKDTVPLGEDCLEQLLVRNRLADRR